MKIAIKEKYNVSDWSISHKIDRLADDVNIQGDFSHIEFERGKLLYIAYYYDTEKTVA